MSETIIGGKRRVPLNSFERAVLRDALHTEGICGGDYATVVAIRTKLGLGPLAGEIAVKVRGVVTASCA